MTMLKNALAGAAAAALMFSQATAAPVARTAAPAGQAEDLGGLPSVATPVILVLSIFALVGLIVLVTDDDEDEPLSP